MKCRICNKEFKSRFWSLSQHSNVTQRYNVNYNIVCERCIFQLCATMDYLRGSITREEFIKDYLDCEE